MKMIMALILVLAGLPVMAEMGNNAGVPQASTQSATTPAPTVPSWTSDGQTYSSQQCDWVKVTVQRVAEKRTLTAYDYAEIERYRCYWAKKGRHMTPSVKNGLVLMLQLDIIHTPIYLCRTFEEVDLAYQIITQLLTRIDWYVRIICPQKLPYTGVMATATVDQWCLEAISLDKPTVAAQKPLPTREQQAVIISKLCFAKSGLTPDRMPFWQKEPVMEWRLGLLWLFRCPFCGGTSQSCGHWPGAGPIPEPGVPY